ncbi:MAG TPA: sigma-54-dependent Fis family transcriptional regulator, partial [Bryobacteraceae bacterium]
MNPYRVLWIKDLHRPAPEPPDASAWRVDSRTANDALDCIRQLPCDIVVLDSPACPADRLLEAVRQAAPYLPVLIRDPAATPQDAVRLARLGAWQFLTEGAPWAAIAEAIREQSCRELAALSENVARPDWRRLLIGESSEMRQVSHIIEMVGARRATVLITGETGTGKELAARALHLAGPRRKGPWVAVNCSALPENLLEDELFGHVRGAFTGAVQARAGRFEQAQGGTLFLDEIGEMPLDLQAKLLRVLQEREFQRLGSSETIPADVRVVAAANCDLAARVDQGRFREDLYYRL